ncbi:tetraspanin-9-like [Mya arenaria]|uniref:tetraspanin-9-like n=1 Tax=Mya arenaria TaxID=6604 RepID=UPI0022E6167B|nr:tetraspanin-9-like [Mya arenaria]
MGASHTGCCGKIFLLFNSLLWLVGIGTLAYGIWIMVSTGNTSNFLSGTLIFTYTFIGVGALLTLIGLLGCIGVCAESTCCLKMYIGLTTILLLVDIGVAIAGGVQQDQAFGLTEKIWDEVNSETKNQIQKELECCGYNNYTDYGSGALPDSCLSNAQNNATLYTTPCGTAMRAWLDDNLPVWVAVLASLLFVQLMSMFASCLTLKNIEDALRVGVL